MKKHWYTVILLYPDYCTDDYGWDTYTTWVLAESPEAAVPEAQERAVKALMQGDEILKENPVDFVPIAAFAGKLRTLLNAYTYTGGPLP